MKKILLLLMFCGCFRCVRADVPKYFVFQTSDLNIFTSAPPALVYVSDSQGRRTGADPSSTITSNGYQGTTAWSGLSEIPLSQVIQDRMENSNSNGWNIDIFDSGPQTYSINLIGMEPGVEEINVAGILKAHFKSSPGQKFNVLINTNQTRVVNVAFDPTKKLLVIEPVVANGDLLNDVELACQLHNIDEPLCKRLTKKANEIQDALNNNREMEAKGLIEDFLNDLNGPGWDGDHGQNGQSALQNLAIMALAQDAKALLKEVEQNIQQNRDK